jgi:hypothetical protein
LAAEENGTRVRHSHGYLGISGLSGEGREQWPPQLASIRNCISVIDHGICEHLQWDRFCAVFFYRQLRIRPNKEASKGTGLHSWAVDNEGTVTAFPRVLHGPAVSISFVQQMRIECVVSQRHGPWRSLFRQVRHRELRHEEATSWIYMARILIPVCRHATGSRSTNRRVQIVRSELP